MDFEGSLTPPLSPGMTDSEPFLETSPVLVAKHRSLRPDENLTEVISKCVEYPDPLLCKSSFYRTSYSLDSNIEETHVGNAHIFWNAVPFIEVSTSHSCDECRRNVMNDKKCLNQLMDADECTNLFYQALMYFQDLEECAKIWMKTTNTSNIHYITVAKKYRKFIHEALSFVCEFIQLCNCDDKNVTDSINHIVDMLIMMNNQSQIIMLGCLRGIIKEDIEISEFGGRIKSTPIREWLHVYVDINSALLKILPNLSKFPNVYRNLDSFQVLYSNGIEIVDQEFHWRLIKQIISQILKLAMDKYNILLLNSKNDKGQFLQTTLFNTSPFPCSCIQQLLSLCFYAASKIQTNKSEKMAGNLDSMDTQTNVLDFGCEKFPLKSIAPVVWKVISVFVSSIIQDSQSKKSKDDSQPTKGPTLPKFDNVQDALSFCWWWTWHFAHLFSLDISGNFQVQLITSTSYLPILSRLIRLSLTSCDVDPKLLAGHLISYQALSSYWRKTSEASTANVTSAELAHFHLLWAHFSRKLNSVKQTDKSGIHKYTTKENKSVSPHVWINKCENYLKYEKSYLASDSQHIYEDPFKIYLSIFGELLSLGCWSAIKDRFYSRLQPNEIKNLTDTGMSRLFQIFILLILSSENNTDRMNSSKKLLEFLNNTFLGKTDYRKQKVMLTGLFACMHISMRFEMDMSNLTTKCGKMMSFVFKLFSESDRNMDQRNSLWKIIMFYLQNLSEICQSSKSFDFGQYLLIPSSGLETAFNKTRSGESVNVLENITTCLSSISSHINHSSNKESIDGCKLMFQNIINQALPWLKEKSKTENNYSEEIVNAVIEICNLLLQSKLLTFDTSSLSITLPSVLEYFSTSTDVKLRTRFLFLLGILSEGNEEMMMFLNQKSTESGNCTLSVIQGCLKCIVSHPNDNDQIHIIRSMLQIDIIQEIFNNGESKFRNPGFSDFLFALESRYNLSKTFIERKERKEQASLWFSSLSDILRSFTKSFTTIGRETTMNIYKTCGLIVQHCSKLLYTSGKSGVIIQIFDTLILPRWIYSSQEKNIYPTLLKSIEITLHMFIKGLLSLDYKRDSYVRRVMSDIIIVYLVRFPTATNSASHPFRRLLVDKSLNPVQRSSIIRLMKDYCKTGPNSDTKLTMVVEIVHSWSESLKSFASEETVEVLQLTEQARSTLRSLPAIMSKVNFMNSLC